MNASFWLASLIEWPLLKARRTPLPGGQLSLFGPKPQPPVERKIVVKRTAFVAALRPPPGGGWKKTPKGWSRGTGQRREWRPDDWAAGETPKKRYQKEAAAAKVAPLEGPPQRPPETHHTLVTSVSSSTHRTVEAIRGEIVKALGKQGHSLISMVRIEKVADRGRIPPVYNHWGGIDMPALPPRTEFKVMIDHEVAIPGHTLLAQIKEGRVNGYHQQKAITRRDYDRAAHQACDVCQTERRRKNVYVVERDADAKHIIVGGECAKNFQGANLGAITQGVDIVSQLLRELAAEEAGLGGALGKKKVYDPKHLVAMGYAASMKTDGYQKHGITRDAAIEIVAELSRDDSKLSKEDHLVIARASKKIEADWPKITAWVQETIDADEKRGRFNEFFATQKAIIDKEAVSLDDMGRLAWLASGYYKSQEMEVEREQRKPLVAYSGAEPGKMHDLPGKWTVIWADEGESDWGTYHKVKAIRKDTGDAIWFRANMGSWFDAISDRIDEGERPELILRGKIKRASDDGKVAFMSHMKEGLSEEEKKRDKETKRAMARERRKKQKQRP